MRRGCRPACHSGRANDGIDSARRTFARRPTATAPNRCRASCGASPALAECDAPASRAGWPPRHSRGRRARRPAASAVGHVRLAGTESHPRGPRPLASRFDCPRLDAPRAGRRVRHRSDAACFHACRGRSVRAGLRPATHRTHRTAVHDGTRPIDVAVAREPIQKREEHQVPDTILLPVAQASPARHARSAAQFLGKHLPRNPATQHEQDAHQAGAIRDARASTARSQRWNRQQRFDQIPQCIGQQHDSHTRTLVRPYGRHLYAASGGYCYSL
jgi:hypothetical protein